MEGVPVMKTALPMETAGDPVMNAVDAWSAMASAPATTVMAVVLRMEPAAATVTDAMAAVALMEVAVAPEMNAVLLMEGVPVMKTALPMEAAGDPVMNAVRVSNAMVADPVTDATVEEADVDHYVSPLQMMMKNMAKRTDRSGASVCQGQLKNHYI
jgi:hypothetical protein